MHLESKRKTFNKLIIFFLTFPWLLNLLTTPALAASNNQVVQFSTSTLEVLIGIGSLVAVVFLIKGGFLYITSSGNPTALEEAKLTIRNTLLGVVLIIAASVIASLLNNSFTTPVSGTNPTQITLTPIEPASPSGGLTQVLIDAVNGFLQNIVSSATKPIIDGVESFLNNTPSVVSNSVIFNYWLIMLGIVDSLFALAVAVLGFQLMSASSFGFEEIEFKLILPRLGVAFLGANMSIFLADWVIQLANALVNAVISSTGGLDQAWVLNVIDVNKLFSSPGQIPLITLIFALMFVVLCIVLLFMYVTRLILVAFGAVMAPFIFLLWAIPKTSTFAELLMKSYVVTIFIVFVHVVVIQLSSAFLNLPGQTGTNSLISIIVAIGLLFTLIRIPQWLFTAMFVSSQGGKIVKFGSQIVNVLSQGRSQASKSRADSVVEGEVKKSRRYLEV